jgi:outer membrane protein TolC
MGRPGELVAELIGEDYSNQVLLGHQARYGRLEDLGRTFDELHQALVELARAGNPHLRASDLGRERRELAVKRNTSRFLPTIGFFAMLDIVDEYQARPGFEEASPEWSVGVRAELPLFLGGQRWRERTRLKAQLSGQEYIRDGAYLETGNRVRVHLRRLLDLARIYPTMARSLELNTNYTELVFSQYNTNQRSIVELIDAAQSERQTSLEAIAIQFGYFERLARLCHEIGWAHSDGGAAPVDRLFERLSVLIQE